jgi:hypothetical protein
VVSRLGTKGAGGCNSLDGPQVGFNVSFNRPFQPNTYSGEYLNYVYLFIFGYSLDMYPRRIRYVSISDTYPRHIHASGEVSVLDRRAMIMQYRTYNKYGA